VSPDGGAAWLSADLNPGCYTGLNKRHGHKANGCLADAGRPVGLGYMAVKGEKFHPGFKLKVTARAFHKTMGLFFLLFIIAKPF
jgi:hypothetical protein